MRKKKDRLTEPQLFDVYFNEGTLQKAAKETGYSMMYLKKLSGLHDWVNRRKLKDVDDPEAYVEIIRGVDGSIQRISKIPILSRLPKSKNKGVEGLVLGDEKIITNKIETDPEGNIVIGKAETKFMREKIREREQMVEAEKQQKKEKQTLQLNA